jgi:hypothetical protein
VSIGKGEYSIREACSMSDDATPRFMERRAIGATRFFQTTFSLHWRSGGFILPPMNHIHH